MLNKSTIASIWIPLIVVLMILPGADISSFVESNSKAILPEHNSESLNFWDEIPVSPSTSMPEKISDGYWHGQYERVNHEVAQGSEAEIVFFGNSITWMWSLGAATGEEVWNKMYSQYHPINMGNSGDITPVMLYRVCNGNLSFPTGHQPKVAVLLCGTNNFVVTQSAGGDVKWELGVDCPPEDVAHGARAIAQVFRRRLPKTRVIMMGILPVSDTIKWAKCQKVNEFNAAITYNTNEVVFVDLKDKFLNSDGSISQNLFTDGTHLTPQGYQIWANSLNDLVSEMMVAEPLDPVKIMLIGGSATEGLNSQESYRRYLDGMLRREGYLVDFIGSRKKHNDNQTETNTYQYDPDHEGHWGKNSDWLAGNLPEILNHGVPDVAVIHTGTEDILSMSGSADLLTDRMIDNISEMINSLRLKNRQVKIVLANAIPLADEEEKVNLLNKKISLLSEEHSTTESPVRMANLHTFIEAQADLTEQGILPNATGAKKMARIFADAIHKIISN
jgi:lysophospholipase L1-like esterase